MKLKSIGYWKTAGADTNPHDANSKWPDVRAFVDESWNVEERDAVARYVSRATVVSYYMGYSNCRICGKLNGDCDFSDGTYIWPEGLVHYLEEHGVRLPHEFVQHAVARLNEIVDAEVDDEWWRSQPDLGDATTAG